MFLMAGLADPKHFFTYLTRLARRRPECRTLIKDALRGRLDMYAEVVMAVAVESGDPIGRVLAEALSEKPNARRAQRLAKVLPDAYESTALIEVGVAITAQILTFARAAPGIQADGGAA